MAYDRFADWCGAVDTLTFVDCLSVKFGMNHGLLQGLCLFSGRKICNSVWMVMVADHQRVYSRLAIRCRVL